VVGADPVPEQVRCRASSKGEPIVKMQAAKERSNISDKLYSP